MAFGSDTFFLLEESILFVLARLFDVVGILDHRSKSAAKERRRLQTQRWPLWRRRRLRVDQLEERIVPTLLGQELFPADYPWNQNIANAPVAANSAAIIEHIDPAITLHPDWGNDSASNGTAYLYGIPVNIVHGNSTPKINVEIDSYASESDIVPVPIPANAVLEGDFQNGPNPNGPGYNTNQRGDSHLIIWDEDNNIAYELYAVARPTDPNTAEGNPTNGVWHAAQESVWNMSTDSFRSLGWTSADAAGLSILAGLARPDEGLPVSEGGQGAIDHALRVTLPWGDMNPQYIYPASHIVNNDSTPTGLPFGARLRLEDTPDVNDLISTMGPEAQIIAHAMQQYGLVFADLGAPMFVSGASGSVNANNQLTLVWNMDDVLGLEQLTVGDFQVIDLTPHVTGVSAASAVAGTAVTITGQNFSGAAGHLSVLFGSTPATSVTYIDDGHVSAVVPAGTGTVDVRVQSGLNETDPNGPTDNVNNPIFGYGISATSAADLFTYATISGAASSASFASPTVAAGQGDVLTIVVKDGSGQPVTGFGSAAFSFTLAGGTSAGTFGTVSETSTQGTYTVTFAGTTAGTADTLTVKVGGVALAGVSLTVTPAATSQFVLSGIPSGVVTGSPFSLTLTAQDPFGNVTPAYTGTVQFTSSDPAFSAGSNLPVNYTFTTGAGSDNGVHTFTNGATLLTPGSQTISVADVSHPAIAGTSSQIVATGLQVTSVVGNATGFTVNFNKPFDPGTLKLYGTTINNPALLFYMTNNVAGATQLTGSVVPNATDTAFTFVETAFADQNGGLPNGVYDVSLLSSANGTQGHERRGAGRLQQPEHGPQSVQYSSETKRDGILDFVHSVHHVAPHRYHAEHADAGGGVAAGVCARPGFARPCAVPQRTRRPAAHFPASPRQFPMATTPAP